jgi:hypothetical protein
VINEHWHKSIYSDNNLLLYNEQVISKKVYEKEEGGALKSESRTVNIRDSRGSDAYLKGRLKRYTDYTHVDFRESVHNTNLATFSENKVVVTGFNVNKQATKAKDYYRCRLIYANAH